MTNLTQKWFWGVCLAALFFWAISVQAVNVRLAEFNVAYGIDTGSDYGTTNDVDYVAVTSIVQRVQPDILCFEELYADEDRDTWIAAAATLGYPYYAMSEGGTFDNSMRTGIWSKHPITFTDHVRETVVDPAAAEIMRWPLHAEIQVPGALNPFHVFVTHNKAGTTTKSARLQRAFEMHRILNYITNMVAQYPLDTEYAIVGDFNDDIGLTQNDSFDIAYYDSIVGSLSAGYNDGTDIPWNNPTNSGWLMPYSKFPTERLSTAGMGWINPAQTGTNLTWTHYYTTESGRYRLDYILFSDEIMNSAYGSPTGEIYNSEFDGVGVGLPKYGDPPPVNASMDASDHRMVFADFHLIDAVPGVTPVGILSEVVDHLTTTDGNYVELANTGSSDLDLTGYSLAVYLNGSTNPTLINLSGSLGSGGVQIVAASTNTFLSTWGVSAQWEDSVIAQLDGNDTVALRKADGNTSDIYGQIGSVPGAWDFTQSTATRNTGVSDPLSIWDSAEWTITAGIIPATPGTHVSLTNAEAFVSSGPSLIPEAPRASNTFAITVGLTPNLVASNLTASGVFRIAGGSWIEAGATNASGTDWDTPMINVAKNEGDVMEYYVRYSYEGPQGVLTNFSSTNSYVFPVFGASGGSIKPMFNEVQADGAGADTNEFVEIIAETGVDLAGYRIEHRNGSDTTDGPVWTFTFPSFIVPDDGVLDTGGHSLGFAVISQVSNNVANTDFLLPGTLMNTGNGLILYDDSGNILDAIVWLGATYDIGVDDPDTVSSSVPPGSANYLHIVGTDTSTDYCPQAPNNVLMSTGTWYSASMTPGVINAQQVSGEIIVIPGDGDLDGLLDDVDNCPYTNNPTQSDTDGDGIGDACDSDIDGDGDLNGADNCPYNANADQSDIDGDGIGDECDPDIDGDGIPNEEDPDPYHTGNLDIDFEDSNLHDTLSDYTPIEIAGRWWVFTNSLVVGTSDSRDKVDGTRAARPRGIGSMNLQGALTNGIGDFEFAYARYKTDNGVTITPQYNAGAGWVDITSVNTTGLDILTTNAATVNVVGPVDFRIIWTAGGTRDDANMDNIYLTSYTPLGLAECTLPVPATEAFDGTEKTADFTVLPLGMSYDVTWSPTPPVELGTYDATVIIPDSETVLGGTFAFTNALTITQGTATCSLDAPVDTVYDGLAHTNAFTVTTGLTWSVTYSPTNPVDPGAYDATVTVTGDAHYLGGTFIYSNAVLISQAQATCSLDAPVTVDYDGALHTNSFTVTPGLSWSTTYSPSTPVDIGVYDVTVGVLGDFRYIGVTSYFPSAVTIQSTNPVVLTVGSPYSIDCEDPYIPDYNAYGPHTNVLSASDPASWFLDNATRGNLAGDVKNGAYSLRMRYIGAAATSNGVLQSVAPFPGIHSVAFNYAMYNGDAAGTLSIQTSPNGADWTAVTNVVVDGIQTNFAAFSNTLALADAAYLRFKLVDGNVLDMVDIDDIVIIPYEPISAIVTLTNLLHTYDGLPKSPTATTDPSGLGVSITCDGSESAPTEAGSYQVVASVTTPGYAGSAIGTLIVARALDSIVFSNTNQPYDGTARSVTATAGSDSPVALTYDGSASAPLDIGVYAVTGIVDAVNWMVTNTTTLTVTASDTAPSFSPLGVQTAYVASASSFNVDAAGYPAPALVLQSTTASNGFLFTSATGQLDYTPLVEDVGPNTFTFTASNSVGVATQVVDVLVISGVPEAPASIWASETNVTDFTAAWSAAVGATEYRLDVSTSAAFSSGGAAPVATLDRGDIAIVGMDTVNPDLVTFVSLVDLSDGTAISFTDNAWQDTNSTLRTGEGTMLWSNDTAGAISAGSMIVLDVAARTSSVGVCSGTSPNLSQSGDQILAYQGDSSSPFFIAALNMDGSTPWLSGAQSANTSAEPDGLTNGVNCVGILETVNAVYDMSTTSGTKEELLAAICDAANWTGNTTAYTMPPVGSFTLTGGGGLPDFLPGYSNRTVLGTSASVTGLTSGVEYFFRASAVSPGGTSVVSSVTSVTTKATQTLTFPAMADQLTTSTLGLTATASSGLLPGFSVASGPAVIAGGTNLSFTGIGSVSIVAFQPGDSTYMAATPVTNIFQVTAAGATVTLGALAQTYDGTARIVTATTVPADLTVDLTYDESATAPTDAGSYTVVGTINDALYSGVATNTLVVSGASASVALGSLAPTYDGTPKSATATTAPLGLTVDFTFNGFATPPTGAGSYAVTGTINDVNYTGSATGTLVIAKAAALVELDDLWAVYDGSAKSATVITTPDALTVTVTYNGSATLPVATGSYAVVASVTEANYDGSASDTFVISAGATTPFEDWLLDQSLDPVDARYATDADDDGDGMTTYEEFLADTDPTLQGNVLVLTGTYNMASASNATGILRLSFPASTGRYYQLVYSTNLFTATITSNLGWGIPGMVVTNETPGIWFSLIRSRLTDPTAP